MSPETTGAKSESMVRPSSLPRKQLPPTGLTIKTQGDAARVQMVSPRTAWAKMGISPPGSPLTSPGGSPRRRRRRSDPRKKILLYMTYFNLLLGFGMIVLYFVGPEYPGHYGTSDEKYEGGRRLLTVNSPIYSDDCPSSEVEEANDSILNSALIAGIIIWILQPAAAYSISGRMGQRGSMCQLISSTMCALTCLGAFTVVLLDMDYVTDCCSKLEDNCELSDLCTEISESCCISSSVTDYCNESAYQLGAAISIFVVFLFTMAQVIMSCTIACKCWVNADPEKQALMMVVANSPRFSPRGSPNWTPRNTASPRMQEKIASQVSHSRPASLSSAAGSVSPPPVSKPLSNGQGPNPIPRRRKGSVYLPEDSDAVPLPSAPPAADTAP